MLARHAAAALVALSCVAGPARAERIRGSVEPRAWIGVGIDSGDVGVLVTDVVDGGPAQSAGLLPGDEIMAVSGERVAEPIDLQRLIWSNRVGAKIELSVRRDDRAFKISATLEAMPDRNEILRRRLVDKPAPAFEVNVLNGDAKGKLSELRGKVVLVEFWSTYCVACKDGHAALSELASKRGRDGLVVLAISRESEAVLKHFLNKHQPAFAVASDVDDAVSNAYHAEELPTLVVIDQRGVVRFAAVSEDPARSGLSTRQAIEANVAAAMFAAERLLGKGRGSGGDGRARHQP